MFSRRQTLSTAVFTALALIGKPSFSERIIVDKRIKLSPGHRVMPYHIIRASNGDLVIFGSIDQVDYRPWATRLTPDGEVRWEFLEGAPDGWNDQSAKGQRFDNAIELPDQTMLFCGIKVVNRERLDYDAVVTGKKNEFAATRSVGLLQAVLEWVSFK